MIAAIALLGDAPLPKIQPRGLRREPTKFTAEVRQYILDHRNQSVKKIHADLVSLGHRVSLVEQALEDVVSVGTESDALEMAESALRGLAEFLRGLQ